MVRRLIVLLIGFLPVAFYCQAQETLLRPTQLEKSIRFHLLKKPALQNTQDKQLHIQENKGMHQQLNAIELQQKAAAAQEQVLQQKGIIISEQEAAQVTLVIPSDLEQRRPGKRRMFGPSQYDSRIELRQLNPLDTLQQRIFTKAASVGLVVRRENLVPLTDSIYRINTRITLGEKFRLCTGQAFATQPVAGEGTAFLIKGKTPQMMTAGHVLRGSLDQYAVIFGFEVESGITGAYETLIPIIDIYYPEKILYKDAALDIAVFSLNKKCDRPPLSLAGKPPQKGNEVYMIGYPCGLPEKVSMNAAVEDNSHPQYFYTSLDAFAGNSGSPVFNLHTHEVIGVLVSGETDFRWNGNCNEVNSCYIPYCKGEKVIRVAALPPVLR